MLKELCYANNQKSLFRKYARLVTGFANTGIGRDYLGVPKKVGLMLPNGFVQADRGVARATIFPRAIYAPKLYPALARLDSVQQWIKDFKEAKNLLAWELGLTKNIPTLAKAIMFAEETFNPDAHVETTSTDGRAWREVTNATWADTRDGAGTNGDANTTNGTAVDIRAHTVSARWNVIARSFYLFDTSALGAGAEVSAAVFSIYITVVNDNFAQDTRLVLTTPASNTDIASTDYQNIGTAAQAPDLDMGVMSASAFNDWTLSETGRGNITVDGITKFGLRHDGDADDSAPAWVESVLSAIVADYADGTNDPKLVVTYTPAAAGGAFLLNLI